MLSVVEIWATPLPEAVVLAVPVPEPEPAELRGEVLISVDPVAVERLLFSLAASEPSPPPYPLGRKQRGPLSSFLNRKNVK